MILLGNGHGNFLTEKTYSTGSGSNPSSIAINDFNNDKYLDLAVVNKGTDTIGIFFEHKCTYFTRQNSCESGNSSGSTSLAIGDFNSDGFANGSFTPPMIYADVPSSHSWIVDVGDFNNDNKLDIVLTNWGDNSVSQILGYGNGNYTQPIINSTGSGSHPVSAAVGIDSIGIFLVYGNGSFAEQLIFSTGPSSSPQFPIAGDFNKDGQLDLAIANYGTTNVGILYGYNNGTFGNLYTYVTSIGSHPTNVQVGDFNNDQQLDIIVVDEVSNNVGIFFGYNDGTFTSISLISLSKGSVTYSVAVVDFNNDYCLDFTIAVYGDNTIGVFLANGSMPFGGQTLLFVDKGSHRSSVAISHFSNDNYFAIAITNSDMNNIGRFLGGRNRIFSNITTFSTGNNSHPLSLAVSDFNNDSLTDIVVTNYNTNNIIILIGYGNGSFSMLKSYSTGDNSQPKSIVTGDFN
ncbi:unnamed protein product [Rotaria magnacalcarata]|uniref:Uncharacterized protein n=2 Tax=Rotaria magnacalcarata TaxID=392030 RepID=A0A819YIJ0_9BILA|nr:unnamed protein product [Rotaria magnacalcarata]